MVMRQGESKARAAPTLWRSPHSRGSWQVRVMRDENFQEALCNMRSRWFATCFMRMLHMLACCICAGYPISRIGSRMCAAIYL